MDCKVWRYTFVLLPKAFWAANVAEFYDAGDFSTPANFERRLGTSLEGIDMSSFAQVGRIEDKKYSDCQYK